MSPTRAGRARESGALPGVAGTVVRSVVSRPWLAPEALAEGLRLARPGWWRRPPFLPLPAPGLWRFRMETAYGGAGDALPAPEDVRRFLRWCAGMRRWRK
jgi:hypothetical protein